MAFNKPAAQISIHKDGYGPHGAHLANDGHRNTDYEGCAGSTIETNPWWLIDLGGPTIVCFVKLTNVEDANGMKPVAVLGKNIWGPGPSSFGRQQRLTKLL